jgi:Tannase and feruloyl esterase
MLMGPARVLVGSCTGGDGAFAVDWLSYLEAWVEKGQPPDVLVGSHVKLEDLLDKVAHADRDGPKLLVRRREFPLDPQAVEFSRPVYPYPTVARYRGHGDPNAVSSFGPSSP